MQRFDGQLLPKFGLSLVVLRRWLTRLYCAEDFEYWAIDCDFELLVHAMPAGYLLAGIKSHCLLSRRLIG